MRKIKVFAFIGMLTITYLVGGIMGFGLCASTQTANANVNSPNEMHLGVHHQTIYVDGEKYIVFTGSSSSIAVIKK